MDYKSGIRCCVVCLWQTIKLGRTKYIRSRNKNIFIKLAAYFYLNCFHPQMVYHLEGSGVKMDFRFGLPMVENPQNHSYTLEI